MQLTIKSDLENIDWNAVSKVIEQAGLTIKPLDVLKKAFQNSYEVIFIFDGDILIGVGRAISDGVCEAGLYDIAVLPEYHGKGIGKLIVNEFYKKLEGVNIILYSRPGVESFYKKMGYSRMKTGMAKFCDEVIKREKGFIE